MKNTCHLYTSSIQDVFSSSILVILKEELFPDIQDSHNCFEATLVAGKYFSTSSENMDRYRVDITYGCVYGVSTFGSIYAVNKVTDIVSDKTYFVDLYGELALGVRCYSLFEMETITVFEVDKFASSYGWHICPIVGKIENGTLVYYKNGRIYERNIATHLQKYDLSANVDIGLDTDDLDFDV